ncbi:hypothetical protein SAMN05444394_3467 [Algoriphagus halophilus]|uniref:Uncharacterized protein n=1 Tax=Algoriphagus halophilus TaxID=226505 RepID=A0A1N6H197_9BACT|nr:hypothetical protein SAMN05444394_3467 [Algoriphagus halophilus]
MKRGLRIPVNRHITKKRLSSMLKLLPFGQGVHAGENHVNTDYYDYLILVRNSEGLRF